MRSKRVVWRGGKTPCYVIGWKIGTLGQHPNLFQGFLTKVGILMSHQRVSARKNNTGSSEFSFLFVLQMCRRDSGLGPVGGIREETCAPELRKLRKADISREKEKKVKPRQSRDCWGFRHLPLLRPRFEESGTTGNLVACGTGPDNRHVQGGNCCVVVVVAADGLARIGTSPIQSEN